MLKSEGNSYWKSQPLRANRLFKTLKKPYGWGSLFARGLGLLPPSMAQKIRFFFYVTKFISVILSKVFKRKIIKISKRGWVIQKKTYFQIKLINQEGVIIGMDETPERNFRDKRSSWSSYIMSFGIVYIAHFVLLHFAILPVLVSISSVRQRDRKRAAMRCSSREILIHCHWR